MLCGGGECSVGGSCNVSVVLCSGGECSVGGSCNVCVVWWW